MVFTCCWNFTFQSTALQLPIPWDDGMLCPYMPVNAYLYDNYTLQNQASSTIPLRSTLPPTLCRITLLLVFLVMMIYCLSCQNISWQRSKNKCYKACKLFLSGFLIDSTGQVLMLLREIITVLPPQLKEPWLYKIIEKRQHNVKVKGINCIDKRTICHEHLGFGKTSLI